MDMILAAFMLVVAVRLVADFCASFLSCLELFFLHIVKKIPEPFSEDWVIGLISGVGYCFAILAVCCGEPCCEQWHYGQDRKVYEFMEKWENANVGNK